MTKSFHHITLLTGANKYITCKRMFAIFKKINGLDWNSFSVNYRNSSPACIDIKSQILNISNEKFPICENENPEIVGNGQSYDN